MPTAYHSAHSVHRGRTRIAREIKLLMSGKAAQCRVLKYYQHFSKILTQKFPCFDKGELLRDCIMILRVFN